MLWTLGATLAVHWAATPWTAEWTRARMVEQDRHSAYQALIDESHEASTAGPADADKGAAAPHVLGRSSKARGR